MDKMNKIKAMELRVKLLTSRGETMNQRLINKLRRRIRQLQAAD